jgi:hypothetical protein
MAWVKVEVKKLPAEGPAGCDKAIPPGGQQPAVALDIRAVDRVSRGLLYDLHRNL